MKRKVAKNCRIYQMLKRSKRRRLSFHTPGHKKGRWDVTELSYSDNLSAPRGVLAQAEKELAATLGAEKSFLLTDGSTAGVLSMLHAARACGVRKLAVWEQSHKSLFNGCALLGITPLVYTATEEEEIPSPPTMSALKEDFSELLQEADGLFITSPSYYGRAADLAAFRAYCSQEGKLLLIDGAHGGHLHFEKSLYAGAYADMWVDGVHKSLPALTQGAVVSAKGEYAEPLRRAVDIFRTTSPSYPIMASVEYAVKYPRNLRLEREVRAFADGVRICLFDDWTKLCVRFGKNAFAAHAALENKGIYPEFCDGSTLLFYLSPATSLRAFARLKRELKSLFKRYPYEKEERVQRAPTPSVFDEKREKEWVPLSESADRICAADCGLFPPCTPLLRAGERIEEAKIKLLRSAPNVYGLTDMRILVFKE